MKVNFKTIQQDIDAVVARDPATRSRLEAVICSSGLHCIMFHRLNHWLWKHDFKLTARILSQAARFLTGIEIHPGARIGKGFFIDHGMGVVIGETAVLGDGVKIYQGVTLGALSFPKDACGMIIKGRKRHPTIENNVTIYAGASVLGDVVIGERSVLGSNVWVTDNVPPGSKVLAQR